jgi:hypothetical protein
MASIVRCKSLVPSWKLFIGGNFAFKPSLGWNTSRRRRPNGGLVEDKGRRSWRRLGLIKIKPAGQNQAHAYRHEAARLDARTDRGSNAGLGGRRDVYSAIRDVGCYIVITRRNRGLSRFAQAGGAHRTTLTAPGFPL